MGSWSHGVAIFYFFLFFFKNKGRKREGREKREENDFFSWKKGGKYGKMFSPIGEKTIGVFS